MTNTLKSISYVAINNNGQIKPFQREDPGDFQDVITRMLSHSNVKEGSIHYSYKMNLVIAMQAMTAIFPTPLFQSFYYDCSVSMPPIILGV